MAAGKRSFSFTVPAGAGQYATEVLYLRGDDSSWLLERVAELTVLVEALPAGAQLEIDLCRAGEPQTAANWVTNVQTHTTTGLKAILQLAAWMGVRIRAKSGGTGGTATATVSWW